MQQLRSSTTPNRTIPAGEHPGERETRNEFVSLLKGPGRCKPFCLIVPVLLFILPVASLAAFPDEGSLQAARNEYALHYFSAEAHVRLAKALYDQGRQLQAFYILETARREHFPPEEFYRAFRRLFRGDDFDNGKEAEAALRNRLSKSPDDYDGLNKLADIYISREEFGKAELLLEHASRVRPNEYQPVEALTEIYRRTDRESQAKSTEWLWLHAHPESVESYATQIERAAPDRGIVIAKEALTRYPKSAVLHFDYGAVLHQTQDLSGAEHEFALAAELDPGSALVQGWLARFYLKSKSDKRLAFKHYLNAYFLDPDFYDTEYAEGRITKLADQLAQEMMEKEIPPGAEKDPLVDQLRPAVLSLFLDALKEHWDQDAFLTLIDVLHDDDEQNRWNSMQMVAQHADASFDQQLAQLLEDPDLCARGMAGYIAVKRWHERALPVMQKWLEDPAVLIRFDAISALAMDGGAAGRQIVQRYLESGKEPDEHLREILPKILAEQQKTSAPESQKLRQ